MKIFFVSFALFFSLANFAFAQIEITEIMYDLEGSDSGREWVEIYNSGTNDVDLSSWKFFENNTNHALVANTDSIITSGNYAIIADNVSKFSADNPAFSGLLFDSSFSLSNTGESIAIKNSDLSNADSVSYNSDMGANGDGNSLQKINDVWVSAVPTPAIKNFTESNSQTTKQNNSSQVQNTNIDPGVWIKDNNKIYADAGEDKTVIVGADTIFNGRAIGTKKEPLEKAEFLWNFGDGVTKKGNNVFHNFRYPGEYVVFLNVSSGAYSSSDRILVNALPSNLSISSVNFDGNSYIELYNDSKREINISFWRLRSGDNYFTIPQNTYILPSRKNIFGKRATGLQAYHNTKIALLYPNGETAYSFTNTPIKYIPVIKTTTLIPISQNIIKKNVAAKQKNKKIEIIPNTIKQKVTDKKDYKQIQNATLGAAVSTADNGKNNTSLYKWLTALVGLVLLSIGGLLFIRSKEIPDNNINSADEIEIIE